MVSDEKLVAAALDGIDGAFAELVTRYQDRLLRFLLARSSSRADAEDAVQDTFINAYRYLASFDSRWQFSTWIYRIAIRNAAKQRSLHRYEPEVEVADDNDPLDACIAHAEHENVWLAARRLLTDEAYAALWLRYVEDLSVKEIASALGRSSAWTKVTLMRCRRKLGAELNAAESPALGSESYG